MSLAIGRARGRKRRQGLRRAPGGFRVDRPAPVLPTRPKPAGLFGGPPPTTIVQGLPRAIGPALTAPAAPPPVAGPVALGVETRGGER